MSLSSDQFVVLPFSRIFDSSAPRDLDFIQGCTSQILSEVVQNLVLCSCTYRQGHFPEESHPFQIRSDPTLYRNLERHHPVSNKSNSVSCAAAEHTSGTRKVQGLTGNVEHSVAARCLWIVNSFSSLKAFTLSCRVWIRDKSSFIVELFPSLHDKFSEIPQFPCNLMHESLDKVCFSSSIFQTFCGSPSELDMTSPLVCMM